MLLGAILNPILSYICKTCAVRVFRTPCCKIVFFLWNLAAAWGLHSGGVFRFLPKSGRSRRNSTLSSMQNRPHARTHASRKMPLENFQNIPSPWAYKKSFFESLIYPGQRRVKFELIQCPTHRNGQMTLSRELHTRSIRRNACKDRLIHET